MQSEQAVSMEKAAAGFAGAEGRLRIEPDGSGMMKIAIGGKTIPPLASFPQGASDAFVQNKSRPVAVLTGRLFVL